MRLALFLIVLGAWGQTVGSTTPPLFPCVHGDAVLMNPKTQYFYACFAGDWYPAFMVNTPPLRLALGSATRVPSPQPAYVEIKRLWRREAFEEALRKYNHRRSK